MKQAEMASPRQLRALFLVGAMAPAVRLIPAALLPWAQAATWMGCFASLPLCVGVALAAARLWRCAEPYPTVHAWTRAKLGKAGACVVLVPVGVWLSIYSGFMLRTAAERLISTIYNDAQATFFVVTTLAVSLWAALQGVRTLGRLGSLVLPALGLLLALTCVLGVGDVQWENLLPGRKALSGIPVAALGPANVCTLMLYSPLLMGECSREPKPEKTALPAALWLVGGTTVMSAAVIGALSAPLAQEVQNPYFLMVRNLSALGEKERVEAVVIALWLISDLVLLPALLRAAGWALSSVGKTERPEKGVWASSVLAAAGTLLWGATSLNKEAVSFRIVPLVNLFFTVVWIPLAAAMGALADKRRTTRRKTPRYRGGT